MIYMQLMTLGAWLAYFFSLIVIGRALAHLFTWYTTQRKTKK